MWLEVTICRRFSQSLTCEDYHALLADESEGFLIVLTTADKGMVDIYNRRPLVLLQQGARE